MKEIWLPMQAGGVVVAGLGQNENGTAVEVTQQIAFEKRQVGARTGFEVDEKEEEQA